MHPMAEFFQQLDQLRGVNQRVGLLGPTTLDVNFAIQTAHDSRK